jgi:hypothetical protein
VRGELIRGDAAVPPVVRLLYPVAADEAVLGAVAGFLQALGVQARKEPDPEVPVLMKNSLV